MKEAIARARTRSAVIAFVSSTITTGAVAWVVASTTARSAAHEASREAAAVVDRSSRARAVERQEEEIRACLRGNVTRGLQLRDDLRLPDHAETFRRDMLIAPILDCRRSILDNAGQAVPLARDQAARYLLELKRGRVPLILRDGTVR